MGEGDGKIVKVVDVFGVLNNIYQYGYFSAQIEINTGLLLKLEGWPTGVTFDLYNLYQSGIFDKIEAEVSSKGAKFIGLAKFSGYIPGIDEIRGCIPVNLYPDFTATKDISGTTHVIFGETHQKLVLHAENYAREFNLLLLEKNTLMFFISVSNECGSFVVLL